MNHTEYLKIEDPDTALAVRLAVTMGWQPEKTSFIRSWCGNYVEVKQKIDDCVHYHIFDPFTDTSIPYGLLRDGAVEYCELLIGGDWQANVEDFSFSPIAFRHKSKTHAIIHAYCQADPMGHWAAFTKESK